MARELRTPDEFREIAEMAEDIASKLQEVAKLIENAGMQGIWTHGFSPINNYLPKTWEWANKLKTEFESDHRAVSQGKISKAEYDKKRNQPKTLPTLDAPSPVKKKATKKRPPKK